jgi:hypothetical protein
MMADADDTLDSGEELTFGEDTRDSELGEDVKPSRLGRIMASLPKVIPKQERLFKAMAVKSLENYHKRAGGDAIGITGIAGQKLDLIPVQYRPPEACDEGEKPGWKAKGRDKVWNAGSEGRVVDYIGRTPVVALDLDGHVEAGWLKPRIAEAIELDNHEPVYTNPEMNVVVDHQPGGGARADGGFGYELELESPGRWMGDALIDLDSGEGYDGMRVSFRKATEWMAETTTTQEMQMQEDRGYLRGKMAAGDGPSLTKLLLICAGIILGVLAIVFIGPQLLGGSGPGGGGSINPLMASLAAFAGA